MVFYPGTYQLLALAVSVIRNESLDHWTLTFGAFQILRHRCLLRSLVEQLFLGVGDYFTAKKSNNPALGSGQEDAAQCLRAEESSVKAGIPFQFGFDAVQGGLLLLKELNNASIVALGVLAVSDATKALAVLR